MNAPVFQNQEHPANTIAGAIQWGHIEIDPHI